MDNSARNGYGLGRLGGMLRRTPRCSFCRRGAEDVGRLVAGASGFICDDCVTKCVAVLAEHGGIEPIRPAR